MLVPYHFVFSMVIVARYDESRLNDMIDSLSDTCITTEQHAEFLRESLYDFVMLVFVLIV